MSFLLDLTVPAAPGMALRRERERNHGKAGRVRPVRTTLDCSEKVGGYLPCVQSVPITASGLLGV